MADLAYTYYQNAASTGAAVKKGAKAGAKSGSSANNQNNDIMSYLDAFTQSMMDSMNHFTETNARAAAEANAQQWAMMQAQMAYNSEEAAKSREFSQQQFQQSMDYNTQMTNAANAFTQNMWNQSANYNISAAREMNEWAAQQAQIQRDWQERMDNTQVQRRMADLKQAGINPILAGGLQASTPSGAMGSTSTPNMSSASGQSAAASPTGGAAASAGLGSAYMENTSNALATMGAVLSSIGQAVSSAKKLGTQMAGDSTMQQMAKAFLGNMSSAWNKYGAWTAHGAVYKYGYQKGWWSKEGKNGAGHKF